MMRAAVGFEISRVFGSDVGGSGWFSDTRRRRSEGEWAVVAVLSVTDR